MTDLAEFLLARIAEDEVWTLGGECECADDEAQRPDCADRILNEVSSKRRIIARWGHPSYDIDNSAELLELLALPFADHPDYDESWRP